MTQSSCSRPVSGELVASMAPGCVVMLAELGRVPSDPWLGRTATPGPAPCYSTITSQLLIFSCNEPMLEASAQKNDISGLMPMAKSMIPRQNTPPLDVQSTQDDYLALKWARVLTDTAPENFTVHDRGVRAPTKVPNARSSRSH